MTEIIITRRQPLRRITNGPYSYDSCVTSFPLMFVTHMWTTKMDMHLMIDYKNSQNISHSPLFTGKEKPSCIEHWSRMSPSCGTRSWYGPMSGRTIAGEEICDNCRMSITHVAMGNSLFISSVYILYWNTVYIRFRYGRYGDQETMITYVYPQDELVTRVFNHSRIRLICYIYTTLIFGCLCYCHGWHSTGRTGCHWPLNRCVNSGLRMRGECRERFPHHRLRRNC